jgi:hypothetical protein
MDGGESGKEPFDSRNELNKVTLFGGFIVFAVIIVYSLIDYTPLSLLIGFTGGTIFLLASIYGTIGRTPKEIHIVGGEMILYSYLGGFKKTPIENIEYLVIHPPDPPQWWKKYLVGGYAKPKKGRTFAFTREIGYAIRESYLEEMGHYPPEKPGVVPWK